MTKELHAERVRLAAETRLARLADSGMIGIIVTRLDGRVIEVNDAALATVGYSREEVLSEAFRWGDLTPPDWRAADGPALVQLTSVGVASLREKQYVRKDGTRVSIFLGTAMLKGTAGECISFVVDLGAARDSTELRKREEHRAFLAAIVDSSDDAIIGRTLAGVITSWNEGAHRLFGYTADEIIGQPVACLVPEDRTNEEAALLEKVARGERVEHFETIRLRKHNQAFPVSVTLSPVRNSAGALIGVSKIVRDITERRRADDALTRAKQTAEAASRELESFSYSVAHDLRAPLRGMNGFAQLLLETYRDKLDAEAQEWLEQIVGSARKMGALIDSLLSLSKLTRSEPRRESVDLSALVRTSLEQLWTAEPERDVDIVVQEHVVAELDPALARALIENLVGNAWKFSGKVPHTRIEFGATQKNGARAFFLRDNGAGFDMAFYDKLFGHFQRLHTVEEFPGTGIGLATVQRIIRRHGGHVWAEGVVDAGATFYFSLPERAFVGLQ